VTPDMLVALTVFLAAGLILRLTSAQATIRVALLLGAVLGLGFLAKTVMFPVGILTIVLCVVALRRSGRRGYALPVVAGFAIVAGPFLVALSRDVGQVTFGEVGRVSYLKHVLLAPYPHYRHDGVDIAGAPVHPMEFAATSPPVVRFDAGIPVTYPPAYDQGYWYAGLAPTFRPALQWRTVAVNLQRYFDLFVRLQGIGLAVLVVVLIVRGRRSIAVESLVLATIALAAMGLYLLVYVEGRYLAPFIVMLWAAALSTVQLPASPKNPPWLRASSFVMVGSFVLNIGVFHLDGLNALLGFAPVAVAGPVSRTETGPDKATDIAVALREQGVAEGDRVGVIGEAIHATWARLARVRIVAEVHPLDAPTFWRGSAEARSGVLAAFDQARVRAVIAETPPAGAPVEEWTRLGNTSYYVRITGRADSISFRAPTR
jgi:hypothetical protein